MSDLETLLLDVDDHGIARLTLNRPDARNAMSQKMIEELQDVSARLANDDGVRGVILSGSGEIFCAGGDLKGMAVQAGASREDRIRDATALAKLLHDMNTLPKPIIGRINGPAYGGGLGLISICDIAIGLTTSKFCLTEVRLGLLPATISPYVVARLGTRNARRVMLNATEMDGTTAAHLGLLDRAVEANQLDAAIDQEIAALLRCAPTAVAASKRLIEFVSTNDVEANIAFTARALADAWETAEVQEGIDSFVNKRKPKWFSAYPK